MNNFETKLQEECGLSLQSLELKVLQVNLGFKCNLSCTHCHLECGPERTEMMDGETLSRIVQIAEKYRPEQIDITGGSPELHPHFQEFVLQLLKSGNSVQVRTNLAVLHESGMEKMPDFFASHKVGVVASMPCYLEENVRKQRGRGVYEKNVQMLKKLNSLGYGLTADLPLHLVYNPEGPFLPPDQAFLEAEYTRELKQQHGISFSDLYTITNMPLGRFWEDLKREKAGEDYLRILQDSFNCHTVHGLMCRHQISVGWNGNLYDCDFNLALGIPLSAGCPQNINEFDLPRLIPRSIASGLHCFGCTAGAGSSCGGALAGAPS